ncbi:hypothetical protein F511_39569 [Dorcoceras hygrometricum]|uniref:Uncharacterized protein n=1 Tax=Dorcoceras hygrometricum TaxID=472368 RepID=A0A2Z7CI23_9LAMI|nr:hypothetical protein F511_39569 [Dorcoceras hygrometricum]
MPPPPPLAHAAVGPPKRRRRPPPLAVFYMIGLVSITATRRNLPPPTVKCRFPCETGRSQAPRRQQALILNFRCVAGRRDPDPPPLPQQRFPVSMQERYDRTKSIVNG